jgi:hypothetical protein
MENAMADCDLSSLDILIYVNKKCTTNETMGCSGNGEHCVYKLLPSQSIRRKSESIRERLE